MSRRKWTAAICVVLAVGMLVSGNISALAAGISQPQANGSIGQLQDESNKDQLEDAEKAAEAIKAERKSAQQRLDSLKADKADLEAYVKELDQHMLEVQEAIATLTTAMEAKQLEIETVQAQLAVYQEEQQQQYEAMKLRIQFMYENGDTQYLDMLFEAKSLMDLLKQAEYISEMVRYDREMLEKYQQTCQEVADTQAALQAEYTELEELKAVNEASLQDLEDLLAAKNVEIAKFTEQINNAQQEVNSYAASLKEQEDLIAKIEEEIRREEEEKKKEEQNKVNANTGEIGVSFIWPIPDSTRITSKFGPRKAPVAGASNTHKGVDVGAPTGTPIYAAAGGTVVISQYNYSAGNYILINHGGGVYTVYMHCSKLLVEVGDKVSQGDKIGLVGSTGYSTGPHLHFGVRINGTYYDPLKYVVVP